MSTEPRFPHFGEGALARCLVVRSGGEQFCLPTSCVRGVLRNHAVYPVPGASAPMVGLAEVGGEPVVVVDLKELVEGRGGVEDHSLILLVHTGEGESAQTVGLAIDEALEMVPVPEREGGTVPPGLVAGEGSFNGQRMRILDPGWLVRPWQAGFESLHD